MSLHIAYQRGITERTTNICLQGSQENPPHGASSSLCHLVHQMGTSRPVTPFRCCLGPIHASCFPPERMQKELQPHGATCYSGGHWLLHLWSLAPLPAGYPAVYTSCTLILLMTSTFLVFTLFTEPRGRLGGANRLEGDSREL